MRRGVHDQADSTKSRGSEEINLRAPESRERKIGENKVEARSAREEGRWRREEGQSVEG